MKKIYAYAENRAIPYLLTFSDDGFTLKDLRTRDEKKAEDLDSLLKGFAID